MPGVQRGCLLLADISGYTAYLSGVELEHAHDILADLLGTVVGELRGAFELAKLEGDAVFCHAPESSADGRDGSSLLNAVDACYFAFMRRQRNIAHLTTCACNACIRIPDLSLKFVVHHGRYIAHEVAGSRELIGPEVVTAHRLLKNHVTERTGLRGYALLTRACLDTFGLDPDEVGMKAHDESFDDVGEIEGAVLDLEARWREEEDRGAVFLTPEEAAVEVTGEVPAPPALVWELMTSPTRRPQWQLGVERVTEQVEGGRRGVGTTNHCFHGGMEADEEIVDWKPYRYYSEVTRSPMGEMDVTMELTPRDDRTRVSFRMRPRGTPEQVAAFAQVSTAMEQVMQVSLERAIALAGGS